MTKKKSMRVDFVKSCITYNKLNTIAKITISGIENICKRLDLGSIYDVINGRFAIPSKKLSGKKSSSKRVAKCDTVFVAYRFCGHPTEEQASDLNQNIGASRFMWNRMLSDYKLMWKLYGISIPMTPADYKDVSDLEWLKDRDSMALANVQINLEKARSDYFAGKRGAPKRKKKHQCKNSYTTSCIRNNIRIEDDRLRLPKINGLIKLSMHRPIKPNGTLKSVTVTHEPDGKWYFSILIEYPAEEAELSDRLQKLFSSSDINVISGIGLDMSVPFLYIDSSGNKPSYELNGKEIKFVKQYRKLEKRIAKEQRRRSHMVKNSNNYNKQSEKIAKLHAKAKHRREDFLHQIAVRLVRTYDVIAIEDLDMAAMKRALSLGKSVSDVGWGRFTAILEELCLKYGKILVRVSRWYPSSKTCHHCGYKNDDLQLSDRVYVCPVCGNIMPRDKNAAINILEEGLRILKENIFRPSVEGYSKPALITTIA